MKIVRKDGGDFYTPPGHDSSVLSKKLFNPENGCKGADAHITTFEPHTSMAEEIHEHQDHIFYMISGYLEILKGGKQVAVLEAGDAVYICSGEAHQVQNTSSAAGVFLALTFPHL